MGRYVATYGGNITLIGFILALQHREIIELEITILQTFFSPMGFFLAAIYGVSKNFVHKNHSFGMSLCMPLQEEGLGSWLH